MSDDPNGSRAGFETSVFTTISEIFVISTALIAIVLNSIFIICVWKVSTFPTGLKIFFLNFGFAACISAFGSFCLQVSNVYIRISGIESVTEFFCSSLRLLFGVPVNMISYQMTTIAVERLIVLLRLKRQQKVDTSCWYYCRKSKISVF